MSDATGQAGDVRIPLGFRAGSARAGIKSSGGPDVAVLISDTPCAAAGVFTTNRIAAAPVKWGRDRVPSEAVRAVVINAGNANAATGARGDADARTTATLAAEALGCRPDDVLVASTGVIGRPLPMDKLAAGLKAVLGNATAAASSFADASLAILTTDTVPKVISRVVSVGGADVTLYGMAKGAAMIGPRMATMLGFLVTDAKVASADLHAILAEVVEETFNCISVEGHTSTNDTVFLLANGAAMPGAPPLAGDDLDTLAEAVLAACSDLARMIPADGEGATHLITIDVEGARTRDEARAIARAVADSPLVKTAIAGADPNWGRIVSAAGYSGVIFDESDLSLVVNGIPLYREGTPLPFDAAAASASIRDSRDTSIRLTLAQGSAQIRVWTCDLTAEYVRLNADYTT